MSPFFASFPLQLVTIRTSSVKNARDVFKIIAHPYIWTKHIDASVLPATV